MKFKLLIFSFIAIVIASFSVGCGTDGPTCFSINNVRDTGVHKIYLNGVTNDILPKINDTLDAVVIDGDSVRITSKALGQTITGKLDPLDCNRIILDSVIIPRLAFDDTNDLIPADSIIITNIRAGGTGTITETGATTTITVAVGNTNIVIGIFDFSNIGGRDFSLRGDFKKLP